MSKWTRTLSIVYAMGLVIAAAGCAVVATGLVRGIMRDRPPLALVSSGLAVVFMAVLAYGFARALRDGTHVSDRVIFISALVVALRLVVETFQS